MVSPDGPVTFVRAGCEPSVVPVISTLILRPCPLGDVLISPIPGTI